MAQKLLAYVKSQNMKHNILFYKPPNIGKKKKKKNDFRAREEIPIGEKLTILIFCQFFIIK